MTVLLTRPLEDSLAVAAELRPLGIASLIWPLTEIAPCPDPAPLPDVDAVLFTSSNGVRAFAAAHARRLPALCVGDRTAAVARAAGFAPVRSAGGDARDLARLAIASGHRRFLHARGRSGSGDLAAALGAAGLTVTERTVYEARPGGTAPPDVARAFAEGSLDAVTLWSPRNARLLAERLGEAPLGPIDGIAAVAISPAAAEPLDGLGFGTIITAVRPDRRAMIEAVRRAVQTLRR